ncbi:MAG: DUF4982 domain-containing protein, partial [Clostridium sp.]|nr:DUF4982 domain-containing protein [Clostridium sp.]
VGAYPIRGNGLDRRGRPQLSIEAPALWNYEDGQLVRVVCYTNAPYAKLMLNGAEVGELKPYDDGAGMIYWDIPFAAGRLQAIGCDEHGNPLSSSEIATTGRPYALRAKVDGELNQEPGGLNHVIIEVVDEEGRLVSLADNNISCRMEAGELIALESADNADMGRAFSHSRRAHGGRLLAYVRNDDQGRLSLTFSSPLLQPTAIN